MVVLRYCYRENHHEGGYCCLETHDLQGEEENKAATAAECREGGKQAAATVATHRWRKNMCLVTFRWCGMPAAVVFFCGP